MKMGSLFDGSGGFPLAASLCGIEPVWASEVEPYPIAVTRSRFPTMKHLGSVTDIHGGEIEPVDIITFGSPCQDLSVAGKRAGLKHEANGDEETTRSGLFMEAVRIIKEMREATGGEYPSFALFENVPGAFSSSKGEDFRVVLEELIGIVEPNAAMPPVPRGGWAYADSYTGDGWSLAYRVFDAQYWGVPQRRRRIHLVLDLRGQRARKVLFECEGVRGYFAQSGAQGKGAAEDAQGSPFADDRAGTKNSNGAGGQVAACLYAAYATKWNGNGGAFNGENFVLEAVPYAFHLQQDPIGGPVSPCIGGQHQATVGVAFQPVPGVLLDDQGGAQINVRTDGKSPTLRAETHGNLPCVVETLPPVQYIVRRLTPTECARLQGFPDKWGHPDHKDSLTAEEYRFWLDVRNTHAAINGKTVKEYTEAQMLAWYNKLHTDGAEYKMWGNGIALPPALYVLGNIKEIGQ